LYLLEHLKKQGHECCVITNRFPTAPLVFEKWQNIPVHRLDIREVLIGKDLRRLAALQRTAMEIRRSFRPDVEHVICTGPGMIIQQMCSRSEPCPFIATLHSDFRHFPKEARGALATTLRKASSVVTLSEKMQQQMTSWFPDIQDRMVYVRSGIPLPEATPTPLPFHPPVLLCYGRLMHGKGFDLALRALALLAQTCPELRMIVAGGGPELEPLQTLALELQLQDRLSFPGWVDHADIHDLINQATAVIVPSRREEPSAVVIREAAQMARPTIASDVGGSGELIQDGVEGCLVPTENPGAIAEAVIRLLSDPEGTVKMGEKARDRVVENSDFQHYFSSLMNLYENALNAEGRSMVLPGQQPSVAS
jgi:glycogen(starch) synthase